MKNKIVIFCFVSFFVLMASAHAADDKPPLPLHTVEGYGGVAITGSAYLVNPAAEDSYVGKPSIGGGLVMTENGQYFAFETLTMTLGDRIELGYGYNRLGLSSLNDDLRAATGVDIDDSVEMHNLNARLALLKENAFNQGWTPAITAGVHGKFNTMINEIDDRLGGVLESSGIEDQNGVDYTVYATKLLKFMPRPLMINVGVRSTKAAHNGLLGFTSERSTLFEGNLVMFATKRLMFGVEYRQKPDEYTPVSGPSDYLVGPEDDWFSLVAAYVVNNNLTLSGGLFDFGQVLNEPDNLSLGLKTKYEF